MASLYLSSPTGYWHEHYLVGIDPVLEAGAVLDCGVKSFGAFAAEGERSRHEAVVSETDGEYLDAHGLVPFGLVVGLSNNECGHKREVIVCSNTIGQSQAAHPFGLPFPPQTIPVS